MNTQLGCPIRVGIAGPVSLNLLDYLGGRPADLPDGYPAPVIAHFANALLRRGHHVVLFTTSRGLIEPIVIDQGRLVICVVPRSRPRSALTFFRPERRWLRGAMAEHPTDIVHAMWSYEFALSALQSGRPTIVHYHDHAWTILKHTRDAYRFLRWILSAYVTSRAHYRIANSAYLKGAFGRAGRGMVVIPNFMPASALPKFDDSAVHASRIVVVSNGFSGRKNVAKALEAFRVLKQRHPSAEMVLVGNEMGVDQEAAAYAREHGLGEGVSYRGERPYAETVGIIRDSSVLLSPALEESFGMTILEAMAVRTAVVAGVDSGNVPELLDDGNCGLLCDVADVMSVVEALESALSASEEMASIRQRAYERYERLYSETAVMDSLEVIYRRVLAGEPSCMRGSTQ